MTESFSCLCWGLFLEINERSILGYYILVSELIGISLKLTSPVDLTKLGITLACFFSETAVNRCIPNPCKNGGTCRSLPEKDDYICDCVGKFSGKDCASE